MNMNSIIDEAVAMVAAHARRTLELIAERDDARSMVKALEDRLIEASDKSIPAPPSMAPIQHHNV
jgi:hypothetical protein